MRSDRIIFRRIYFYCEQKEKEIAFMLGCGIQPDLNDIAKEYKISYTDILSHFDANNLEKFSNYVNSMEKNIISLIEENGVKIQQYASVDEFVKMNS